MQTRIPNRPESSLKMSGQNDDDLFGSKQPVFSKRIDGLILEIWELGGKAVLYANINRLKILPEADFEAELVTMRDALRSKPC